MEPKPGDGSSDNAPRSGEKPTGLRPVLDAIPDHCYERSTIRGLGLLARDLAMFALAVVGLASTDHPLLLIPLWLLAGLAVSGLFVVGHDAAHDALFDDDRLNKIVARVAMLPSLHATEIWVFGHNRVHHGHTLRQGMDFVWHPLTTEEYLALTRLERLRHHFEWGPFGSGAYYLRAIWWNKMVRFVPPPRWARAMRIDQGIVVAYALGTLALAVALRGWGGPWLWAKTVVVPFLLFCHAIGWVVYVHHIHPTIRWWPRRSWNRFRGQVEGTTILWAPAVVELFFHWIMVHIPHHVDARIPCYRLPDAARAIARAFPDDVEQRPLSLRSYLQSTKACKIHDFENGRWLAYPRT